MPGMNPKQMQKIMAQMGIKNSPVDASRVTIEKKDGSKIVVDNPQVTMIEMQGQKTFQVAGNVSEQLEDPQKQPAEQPETDADLVAKQANVSKEQAQKALDESQGDIAQAITKLQNGEQ